MAGAPHQLNFFAQVFRHAAKQLIQTRVVQTLDDFTRFFAVRLEQMHAVIEQVKNTFKALAHADWPGDRRTLDIENGLDFIQQFNRFASFTVQFVDKSQDRRIAQAADFHQFDGTFLNTFGAVDDH